MRGWISEPQDMRPDIGRCEFCGEPIRGRNAEYYADFYYEFDSSMFHEDCAVLYLDKFCRKGGD